MKFTGHSKGTCALAVIASYVVFFCVGQASADLVGITWTDSRLVSFDPCLGAITQEHVQLNDGESFRGLTYVSSRSKLYALSQCNWNLYSIHTNTLNVELVGKLDIDTESSWGEDIGGLTYDPVTDTLYSSVSHWDPGFINLWSELVEVDLDTAEVTSAATITNAYCYSLSYNTTDGQIYAYARYGGERSDRASLVSINPDNASMTTLFETPYATTMGLAKKPGQDIFYTWINSNGHFYGEVDLNIQTVTLLCKSDSVGVSSDAMIYKNFYLVPEPTTLLLLGLSSLALLKRTSSCWRR